MRLWSAGEANHREREQYVVSHFLRCLGMRFDRGELKHPPNDPPDVLFRDARFEIKEIQTAGRRRGDEYRQRLARALCAERFADLLQPHRPEPVPIAQVCTRLMHESRNLASGRYRDSALRRSLDLVFYISFSGTVEVSLAEGPLIDLDPLRREGWRSVSFLFAEACACVLIAANGSPAFLSDSVGRIAYPQA